MKRREGIGGVTIAVFGLVLAFSVGIAATAHGGVFNEGLIGATPDPAPAAVPDPGTTLAHGAWQASPARAVGVRATGTSARTTTRVTVQTVVSGSAASASGPGGTCIVKTSIVTSAPVAQSAEVQPQLDVGRHLSARGGQALQGSKA